MPSVLIVDDAPDIRFLVRAVLSRSGFEITEAEGGSSALAVLDAGARPDVIVLDVQMPDMDGWATLAAIRERTDDVPVILCTVKASDDDAARAWTAGCDGYLTKPFSIHDLVDEVTAVAGRTHAQRVALRAETVRALESEP